MLGIDARSGCSTPKKIERATRRMPIACRYLEALEYDISRLVAGTPYPTELLKRTSYRIIHVSTVKNRLPSWSAFGFSCENRARVASDIAGFFFAPGCCQCSQFAPAPLVRPH
jgi:hypothetical protein